jgi:hypothetical protein
VAGRCRAGRCRRSPPRVGPEGLSFRAHTDPARAAGWGALSYQTHIPSRHVTKTISHDGGGRPH